MYLKKITVKLNETASRHRHIYTLSLTNKPESLSVPLFLFCAKPNPKAAALREKDVYRIAVEKELHTYIYKYIALIHSRSSSARLLSPLPRPRNRYIVAHLRNERLAVIGFFGDDSVYISRVVSGLARHWIERSSLLYRHRV